MPWAGLRSDIQRYSFILIINYMNEMRKSSYHNIEIEGMIP